MTSPTRTPATFFAIADQLSVVHLPKLLAALRIDPNELAAALRMEPQEMARLLRRPTIVVERQTMLEIRLALATIIADRRALLAARKDGGA